MVSRGLKRVGNALQTLWKPFTNPVSGIWNPLETRGAFRITSGGAFHYAKYFRNFGRNSNGKVRFGFFRPEYSGSPLEVVLIFRLEYSDRNVLFHLQTFWFPVPVFCHFLSLARSIMADTESVQSPLPYQCSVCSYTTTDFSQLLMHSCSAMTGMYLHSVYTKICGKCCFVVFTETSMYKPHFFSQNWSQKSRVRLIHGYIYVWSSQKPTWY